MKGAIKTRFAFSSLSIGCHTFWFDGNGKITLDNGTFDNPAPNAFSLVQVADCPGATAICKKDCYVNRLEEAEPEVHAKYRHNSSEIRKMLDGGLGHRIDVAEVFASWIKVNARHGFRWHVSGDVFSGEYAAFIAHVCTRAPEVPFWLYTRTFNFLTPLVLVTFGSGNLVVNLSADADNYAEAMAVSKFYRGLRICYMTVDGYLPDDLPDGSVIFPSHQLRGRDLPKPTDAPWWQGLTLRQKKMVCPPDFFGQSERMRCGPCQKCLV